MGAFRDRTGERHGFLVVLGQSGKRRNNKILWRCRCDCGNETLLPSGAWVTGNTRSCGCVGKSFHETHGMSKTPIYGIWANMWKRCTNPNSLAFKRYGGRGIRVCKRWERFENFYADMGDRPIGSSLDRINNDGNYTPKNCKWSTRIEQGNNTSANRVLEYDGEKMTITQWAAELGVKRYVLQNRLNRGWSASRTLTTPVKSMKAKEQGNV